MPTVDELGEDGGFVDVTGGIHALPGVAPLPLPEAGRVGIVVSSTVEAAFCLDVARRRHIGVDAVVAVGPGARLTPADVLDELVARRVDTVAVVLRSVDELSAMADAIKRAADDGVVPLVLAAPEPGRASAALLETYLDQLGAHFVRSLGELFELAYAFSRTATLPAGGRVCLITGSGGVGVLMADRAEAVGLAVDEVPERAQARLLELCAFAGVRNPVDTTAQIGNNPDLFAEFLRTVLAAGSFDATVNFMSHVGLNKPVIDRRRIPYAAAAREFPGVVNAVTLLFTDEVQSDFEADGFLVYEEPVEAVSAIAALAAHARRRARRQMSPLIVSAAHGSPTTALVETIRAAGAAASPAGTASHPQGAGLQLAVHCRTHPIAGVALTLGFAGRSSWLGPADEVEVAGPYTLADAGLALDRLGGSAVFDGLRGDPPYDRRALEVALVAAAATCRTRGVQSLVIDPLYVGPVGQGTTLSARPDVW